MIHRGDHEAHQPKPGDMWPPVGHEHVTEGVQADALRKRCNMAKQIESIEIFHGENGGHRAVHNFKLEPSKKEGAMAGGRRHLHTWSAKAKEHFFGTSEDGKVLPHVGKALNPPWRGQGPTVRPRRYRIERATEQDAKFCNT